MWWWLPALGLVLVAGFLFFVFNRLVGLRNRAAAAWSDIDVQLKRRHDLVANLVETVKGYAAHEATTLREVTDARARAERAQPAGPGAAGAAEQALTGQIRTIFALAEQYPDLKAARNFQELHHALVALEDAIQHARRYYNAVVRDLNTRIQSIPDLLVARPCGFTEREYFQLDDRAEAQAPRARL